MYNLNFTTIPDKNIDHLLKSLKYIGTNKNRRESYLSKSVLFYMEVASARNSVCHDYDLSITMSKQTVFCIQDGRFVFKISTL